MFSIGEIKPLSSESPAVRKFKPWWEHVIEYLCYGLLALSLLGWARVSSVQSSTLICTLKDKESLPDWSVRDATYVNQRCLVEMSRWLLLFYPYLLLIQWLVIFTIQCLWLKLPAVCSRLETFHKLYTDMTLVPAKYGSPYMGNEVEYEGEGKEVMNVLRAKLLWLLREDSVIFQAYRIKVWTMKLVIFFIMALLLYWIFSIGQFETVVLCKLPSSEVKIGYPDLLCNLTTGMLLYVLVISNVIMITCIFLLNLRAMSWLFNQRKFVLPNIKEEYWELCKGFQGFEDFRFTLHLVFDDIHESHHIMKILRFCLFDYLRHLNHRQSARSGEAQTRL